MKHLFFIIPIFLGITLFTSCDKENIDISETEDNFTPELLDCDLDLVITEEPLGTLTATGIDGSEPYFYLWSTREETNTIIADTLGIYTVIVIDNEGCFISDSIIVDSLPVIDTIPPNPPNPLCDSLGFLISFCSDGGICCSINGDAKPFTYIWSTGETTPCVFANPSGGSCTVTDANGCERIFEGGPGSNGPQTCSVEASISEDGNGIVSTNSVGGTGSYRFRWNTGETTQVIQALHSGEFVVTVIDDVGCGVIKKIQVKLPGSCENFCADFEELSADEFLEISPTGGSGNYAYIWSTGETANRTKITKTDCFSVTITDEDTGCLFNSSKFETINNAPCQSFNVTIRNDNTTGNLFADASSGVAPFTYNWFHGETSSTITPTVDQVVYRVAVTDANNCVATTVFYR